MSYSGWLLSEESRAAILNAYPPKFGTVDCHHVTYRLGDHVPETAKISVVGYSSDNKIECLVVEVDGTIHREDENIYHITISYDAEAGARPRDSKEIAKDYVKVKRLNINANPQFFES